MTPDEQKLLDRQIQFYIDSKPGYPLGETDARNWAIAWRLIRDKHGIDANGDTDGWMIGWFACALNAIEGR